MNPPAMLAVTMWMTWTIHGADTELSEDTRGALSAVSLQRLKAIGPHLVDDSHSAGKQTGSHQLVRFNLYNFGEKPVSVVAIALKNLQGERLSCPLLSTVMVSAGARQPFSAEVTRGPVLLGAEVAVEDSAGQRDWISVHLLPGV
jgi:hypothetical protein